MISSLVTGLLSLLITNIAARVLGITTKEVSRDIADINNHRSSNLNLLLLKRAKRNWDGIPSELFLRKCKKFSLDLSRNLLIETLSGGLIYRRIFLPEVSLDSSHEMEITTWLGNACINVRGFKDIFNNNSWNYV